MNHKKKNTFYINNEILSRVPTFSYLGILFNEKNSWSNLVDARIGSFNKNVEAIFRVTKKLGSRPIKAITDIYKARTCAGTLYGAGVWGFTNTSGLQRAENMTLKRLLTLPKSTPAIMCHNELGVNPLTFYTKLAPMMLWHNIWIKEEPVLNRDIILDCLKMDSVKKIPWLSYIQEKLGELGLQDCFSTPGAISAIPKIKLKKDFLLYLKQARDDKEMVKKRVAEHSLLVSSPKTERYLSFYFNQAKMFYVIRFRMGIAHLLVSYPRDVYCDTKLEMCPCDSLSAQSTLHFMFFCKLYADLR